MEERTDALRQETAVSYTLHVAKPFFSISNFELPQRETLTRDFHLLMLEEPPYYGTQNQNYIGVTHVCWHWRQSRA